MVKKKIVQINFRTDSNFKKEMDTIADRENISTARLIETAIRFYKLHFPKERQKGLNELAQESQRNEEIRKRMMQKSLQRSCSILELKQVPHTKNTDTTNE